MSKIKWTATRKVRAYELAIVQGVNPREVVKALGVKSASSGISLSQALAYLSR
jgi:hypothetical protein